MYLKSTYKNIIKTKQRLKIPVQIESSDANADS